MNLHPPASVSYVLGSHAWASTPGFVLYECGNVRGNVRKAGIKLAPWKLCVAIKELSLNGEIILHEIVWQGEGGVRPRSPGSRQGAPHGGSYC